MSWGKAYKSYSKVGERGLSCQCQDSLLPHSCKRFCEVNKELQDFVAENATQYNSRISRQQTRQGYLVDFKLRLSLLGSFLQTVKTIAVNMLTTSLWSAPQACLAGLCVFCLPIFWGIKNFWQRCEVVDFNRGTMVDQLVFGMAFAPSIVPGFTLKWQRNSYDADRWAEVAHIVKNTAFLGKHWASWALLVCR